MMYGRGALIGAMVFALSGTGLPPRPALAQSPTPESGQVGAQARRPAATGPVVTRQIVPRPSMTVRGRTFAGVYRLLDDKPGILARARFENIDAVVGRGGFRIGGDAHDIVIRNVTLRLAAPTSPPDLPAGIEIVGRAHDVLIDHVTATGFRMIEQTGLYTNGDGFSTERGVSGVTYRSVGSFDNSDGGFDLKSTDTLLDRTTAARNGKNYRLWGSGTATRIDSIDPRLAHIQMNGGADWHIGTLVARSTGQQPIIAVHGDGQLTIDRCELTVPQGTVMVRTEAKFNPRITLGEGCRL